MPIGKVYSAGESDARAEKHVPPGRRKPASGNLSYARHVISAREESEAFLEAALCARGYRRG